MSDGLQNLRRSRGLSRCDGIVSGYVFKLARESVGHTQADLAERLGVDITTMQAWESGRRPLTALKTGDLARLRMRMIRLGAAPWLFEVLTDAIEADLVIADSVAAGAHPIDPNRHAMAVSVHRRRLTSLITWPLTGSLPAQLARMHNLRTARRGPVANMPALSAEDRARFFDHLLTVADNQRGDSQAVLRRQAIYLLGFDDRPESIDWLAAEQRRAVHAAGRIDDVPSWVAVRSSAVALARRGDSDPLRTFVASGLTNETQDLANLNYWAYWVGELPGTQADDKFMIATRPEAWSGTRLFPHLINNLQPGSEQAELYIHTLWTLLATHPALLQWDRSLCTAVFATIEQMATDPDLTAQARQELASVAYAIRLSLR